MAVKSSVERKVEVMKPAASLFMIKVKKKLLLRQCARLRGRLAVESGKRFSGLEG
jgi:hypothetical protein